MTLPDPVYSTRSAAGVYVFRTRRPGFIGLLPCWVAPAAFGISAWALLLLGYPTWPSLLALLFCSRHNAYVGETVSIQLRKSEHLSGGGRFKASAKPWADLAPSFYYVPLPSWKWLLLSVETLGILLLWPVYNHQKNLWNPRRIPLRSARRQRALRDRSGWSLNGRPIHLFIAIVLAFVAHQGGLL